MPCCLIPYNPSKNGTCHLIVRCAMCLAWQATATGSTERSNLLAVRQRRPPAPFSRHSRGRSPVPKLQMPRNTCGGGG